MAHPDPNQAGFVHPPGRWVGRPEVYDASGAFLGFATDQRRVADLGGGRVSMDIAIDGPFKIDGQYFIHDHGTFRNYLGPANIGGADILAPNLIDSTSYWTEAGLTQRFILMILPDEGVRLSLTLLSRGEMLKYVVIGESIRVTSDAEAEKILHAEPVPARHGAVYSEGKWAGQMTLIDHETRQSRRSEQIETFSAHGAGIMRLETSRTIAPRTASVLLHYDEHTFWTLPGQQVSGSASIWGGRAMSSTTFSTILEDTPPVRSWRREIIRRDGSSKAVVTLYTQRGSRVAASFGLMRRVDN